MTDKTHDILNNSDGGMYPAEDVVSRFKQHMRREFEIDEAIRRVEDLLREYHRSRAANDNVPLRRRGVS